MYALGVITGLVIAVIIFLSTKRYEIPIERTLKQLKNKTSQKGDVFIEEDIDREISNLLEGLPNE